MCIKFEDVTIKDDEKGYFVVKKEESQEKDEPRLGDEEKGVVDYTNYTGQGHMSF